VAIERFADGSSSTVIQNAPIGLPVRPVRGMMFTMADRPAWTPEALASPHAVHDKAGRVQRMFNTIAPRYQLINSLFSAGRDRAWRRRAVELACIRTDDIVLDVACGTGDFARAFAARKPRTVLGCDFAHQMLTRAAAASPGLSWHEADALRLPIRDASVSIVSCAFGVRNFEDLSAGLREMHRVLITGGRVVILEFTRPTNPLARRVFELYSNRLMPAAATWVAGDRSGAYRYLPRSVVSFLDAPAMIAELQRAGFERATATPLTGGVVTIYLAYRSASDG